MTRVVTRLEITGMTCGRCGSRVKAALHGVRGVIDTQVDWRPALTPDAPWYELSSAEHTTFPSRYGMPRAMSGAMPS